MSATLAGAVIACAIGLTGMGGGVLTVPVLILYLGVEPAIAVGTALSFSAAVKLPAAAVYLFRRHVSWRVLALLLTGGLPGVAAGALLVGGLTGAGARARLTLSLGAIVVLMALVSLARLRSGEQPTGVDRPRLLPWLGGLIGVEVGFSSAGAGALGTAGLLRLTTLAPVVVVGTDLCFGLALSALGGAMHSGVQGWNAALLQQLALGGVPGALLGASLAPRIPARALRVGLLIVLLLLGGRLFLLGLAG